MMRIEASQYMEIKFCICYLTVSGNTVDLLRFDREFEQSGTGYSNNNLYPTPAGLDANDAYSWRNSNWGTPWDIEKCFVSKKDDKFEYVIKIAWEAPQGVILEASRRFPGLSFSYSYGSYNVEGITVFENGKAVRAE